MQVSSPPPTQLFASGSNAIGQLANGTTIDSHAFVPCIFQMRANVTESVNQHPQIVQSVATGGRHTLILLSRHADSRASELWGCGDGSRGQLGPQFASGADSDSSTSVFRPIDLPPEILQDGYSYRLIACSWETSYIVLSCPEKSDLVVSMGADDFGNLGVSSGSQSSKKRKGDSDVVLVHRVNFDHILPRGTVNFVVALLAAGLYHVVVHLRVTLADGSTINRLTVGWGISRHGQLDQSATPLGIVPIPRLISSENTDDDPLVSMSLGNQHTVLLHNSGRLSGFGSNKKGQLLGIDGQQEVRAIAIGCTWNGTYVVTEHQREFRILSTGSHSKGQLGRIDAKTSLAPVHFPFTSSTHRFVAMACGSEHVIVLFEVIAQSVHDNATREVWAWGWNEHGNLGTGNTDDVTLPQKIWPNPLNATTGSCCKANVVGIWAGCGTSWIGIRQSSS